MNRALYISGFANGRATETQLRALSEHLNVENVESRTIAEALRNPDEIRKIGEGAIMATHSAGMLAVPEVRASEVHAFNPPIRTKIAALSLKAAFGFMHDVASVATSVDSRSLQHMREVIGMSEEEMRLRKWAYAKMVPEITRFDAFEVAHDHYSPTILTWTTGDDFFRPGVSQVDRARSEGIRVLKKIPGGHSRFVFQPNEMLREYADHISFSPEHDGRHYRPSVDSLQAAS